MQHEIPGARSSSVNPLPFRVCQIILNLVSHKKKKKNFKKISFLKKLWACVCMCMGYPMPTELEIQGV